MGKVKLRGTLDRRRGYQTPSPSEVQCPYFKNRFLEVGDMNEKRGLCQKPADAKHACDYQYIMPYQANKEVINKDETGKIISIEKVPVEGEIPICLRYMYTPKYEITFTYEDVGDQIPYIQANIYTVMLDLPLEETSKEWTDFLAKFEEIRIVEVLLEPVKEVEEGQEPPPPKVLGLTYSPKLDFFSMQYIDTHEKVYSYLNGFGWDY